MTIEEAIETIEYARAFNEENTLLMKAWDLIIDYVRAQSANDGQMKSDGWISVNDRLPRDDERVLLYRDNMDEFSISVVYGWSVINKARERGITHWMPLPEPPKSEGGDEP